MIASDGKIHKQLILRIYPKPQMQLSKVVIFLEMSANPSGYKMLPVGDKLLPTELYNYMTFRKHKENHPKLRWFSYFRHNNITVFPQRSSPWTSSHNKGMSAIYKWSL